MQLHFPGRFVPIISANHFQFNVWQIIGVNRVGNVQLLYICHKLSKNEQTKQINSDRTPLRTHGI